MVFQEIAFITIFRKAARKTFTLYRKRFQFFLQYTKTTTKTVNKVF